MLVLHACWLPDVGAAIWAEDSEKNVTSPSYALATARPHPFAASWEQLDEVISGEPVTVDLDLPSTRRSPSDSPEMIRVTPRRTTAASLLPWQVPAVVLDPASVEQSLEAAMDSVADMRPAASVRMLLELARYGRELVDRGRVIPDLIPSSHGGEACWRVALTGTDATAAHSRITSLPPSMRAAAPDRSPAEFVHQMLDLFADACVRSRLKTPVLPPRRGRMPARIPVAERWLTALIGAESWFAAEAEELAELDEQLSGWRRFGREEPGPAQLVLRVSEPQDEAGVGEAPWRVAFLLRSRSDPSLVVSAPQIWEDDGALNRWLERPREVLLSELARAARVYPALEPGLRQARPEVLGLDTAAAHDFLLASPALSEAGVEVLLPAWWGRSSRLGLRLTATPSDRDGADGRFGKDSLCDFHWDLAVGEHDLSPEEVAALVAAKAPLVRVRGQWIAVDQHRLDRGMEFLRTRGTGQMTAREIMELGLSHPDDVDLPVPVEGVTAEGWLGALLSGTLADTIGEITLPDDFTATLRPYQRRGLGWLDFLGRWGLGACLADDMGLGKTVQLLALEATARARSREEDGSLGPTLLLCPMSVIGNWQAEAGRFAPSLRVFVHHGPTRVQDDQVAEVLSEADLVVTTYTTAMNDIEQLSEIGWERVVLDEAQAIKNRHTRTAKAVRRLRAEQRIALTGTPVENHLSEWWSIMDFLNPGMLGSPEVFRARFATPIERHRDEHAVELLRRITRPYILRRVKTDPTIIDDLPEKLELKQYYRLTVEQASLYQSVVDDMMERIDSTTGIERRGNVLAAMAKLKQVCNHPAQLLHDRSPIGRRSGKLIRLEEIMDEILAAGDKVLCFTQYTEFAELLLPHLAARFDTDIAYLSGSTSRTRRSELVKSFQSEDGPPVFLLSLKAGGTGLNLTAANHVIHLDRWWNPAVENQATDRAFRIGQKRQVQVHKFIGSGTLEERIDEMIEDKKTLADLAIGDGETWLTELSTSELRDLFALTQEAVGE